MEKKREFPNKCGVCGSQSLKKNRTEGINHIRLTIECNRCHFVNDRAIRKTQSEDLYMSDSYKDKLKR